jgi:hypothetical protein
MKHTGDIWNLWKPYVYLFVGLFSAWALQHPSGVCGGVLLAAAGVALARPVRKTDRISDDYVEQDFKVDVLPLAAPRSYYNDYNH